MIGRQPVAYEAHQPTGKRELERFYAKHLPLSREMAKNLQSFGEG